MRIGKWMSILILAMCALLLIGSGLVIYMMVNTSTDDYMMDVQIDGNTTEILEFRNLNMIPGDEIEYTLKLIPELSDTYTVTLKLNEIGANELREYARGKILYGETVLCDGILKELFAGEPVVFEAEIKADAPLTLSVIYSLPEEVGNEAQGAQTNFDLVVTVSNE